MKNVRFLHTVRQYTALSRRFNRDYAEVLQPMVEERVQTVMDENPGMTRPEAEEHVLSVLRIEYKLSPMTLPVFA